MRQKIQYTDKYHHQSSAYKTNGQKAETIHQAWEQYDNNYTQYRVMVNKRIAYWDTQVENAIDDLDLRQWWDNATTQQSRAESIAMLHEYLGKETDTKDHMANIINGLDLCRCRIETEKEQFLMQGKPL